MQFGIFDHLDRNGSALPQEYDERLKLAELYDRLGFFAYHVAEHHSTPLGMAPSPSVYIASVIQRTQRLRVGPLVYLLPLYHPLRLIEEVCMLDNLSNGRLELGVGRGISPFEVTYYGRRPEETKEIFEEALRVLVQGLTQPSLSFEARFNQFNNVPMSLQPVQQPHPPIWLGISSIESATFAARAGYNVVGLMPAVVMRERVKAYRASLTTGILGDHKVGISYLIVVGDDDASALEDACDAYAHWHASFHHLYRLHGREPMLGAWPADFVDLMKQGRAVAGSPQTVADFLSEQVDISGINYVVSQLMFGTLAFESAKRSATLFAEEVIPRVKATAEAPISNAEAVT